MVNDSLARFRALQANSAPQTFNSDTTSSAIENNAQAIEAYLESVRKSQEQSQPTEPNMTVDGTTEAPSYDFTTPVAGESAVAGNIPRVTQSFGNRSSVEAYSKGVNLGTDFGVKKGTPLALPPGEWEVMTTFTGAKEGNRGANSGSGNLVKVVNTKTGEMLAFEHLSGVGVRPGQRINGGTVIGLSGNTGNSTGPHASIPYQDAQGKYHDILSSPYAQYIFGNTQGSTSGKGGGKMADIQTKVQDFIKKLNPYAGMPLEIQASKGIDAAKGAVGNLAQNVINSKPYKQFLGVREKTIGPVTTALAPIEGVVDYLIRQGTPEEKVKAIRQYGPNLITALQSRGVDEKLAMPIGLGLSFAIPGAGELSAINRASDAATASKVISKMHPDDIGALDWAMDTIKNKNTSPSMAHEAQATIARLQEGYKIAGENPFDVGKKLQKLAGTESGTNYYPNSTTPVKPLSVEPVGGKKVYHATSKQFDNFDISKAKTDMGGAKAIFFSETPEGTKYYQRGENSRVIETNISPEAKIFDYQNPEHTALLENFIQESSKNKPEWGDSLRRLIKSGDWGTIEGKDIQGVIKKLGFDGFYDMDMTGHRAIGITNPKVISPSPLGGKDLLSEARKYKSAEEFAKNNVVDIKLDPAKKAGGLKTTDPFSYDKTTGTSDTSPIKVKYNTTDGTYTVIDGNTRIRQALSNGETSIKANVGFWDNKFRDNFYNQAQSSSLGGKVGTKVIKR